MDILNVIQKRFSAQSFDGKALDDAALERILEAGRMAPSAKNRQAWRFVAVRSEEVKGGLADACYGDRRIIDAGCVIAACTTNIQYTMPNGQLSYPLDLGFAVSFMALQAQEEGLGSALLGTYNEDTVKELLTVPYAMRVVLLLAVGHTSESPPIKERLPKDRVISYDHW